LATCGHGLQRSSIPLCTADDALEYHIKFRRIKNPSDAAFRQNSPTTCLLLTVLQWYKVVGIFTVYNMSVLCYQVNVLALSICTREAVKLMRECGIDDGHIIHMNRCVSFSVPYAIFVIH